MRRTKKYSIIEHSISLFKKFGIRKVTVEDICSAASVSKGTFYKYFGNKTDLIESIIKRMSEKAYKEYDAIMEAESSFEGKVEALISMKLQMADELGSQFLKDMYENLPEVRSILLAMQQDSMKASVQMYNVGKTEGRLRKEVTLEFFMLMLEKTGELYFDERVKAIFPEPRDRAEAMLGHFFYGIISKPQE